MSSVDRAISAYVHLRDEIETIKKRHKEELKALNEKQEKLSGYLGKILEQSGVKSMKSDAGTVFQATKDSVRVADKALFSDFVVEQIQQDGVDALGILTLSANKNAIKAYMEDNKDSLPPGVTYERWHEIQIRRA